jgi:nucleotide-binding universal stress UspA family protein
MEVNMYHTILVPLDGSKRAEAILPHVEELAQRNDSKVILLRVIEPDPITYPDSFADIPPDPQSYQRRSKEAERYLSIRRGDFRQKGIKAETQVGDGPVVATIINAADQANADLIAMASHGRTGLPRVFYGSVAAGVLHLVDRPLLLIRSSDNGTA